MTVPSPDPNRTQLVYPTIGGWIYELWTNGVLAVIGGTKDMDTAVREVTLA
jgi:hypothetical protein